jgi:hypothetical protein
MAEIIDLTNDPTLVDDTQASLSPYSVGKILWNFVEPYFVQNYEIQVTEQYPQSRLEAPTITWRTLRRTPGRGANKVVTGKGANFSRFLKAADGLVYEIYAQVQTIILEYAIFGTSSTEVDTIAWDFENAIQQAAGQVQLLHEGFTLTFMEQIGDTNMDWRSQDDLNVRTCRFECSVPIMYTRTTPELVRIEKYDIAGYNTLRTTVTRDSDSTTYSITAPASGRVVRIHEVSLFESDGTFTPLLEKVDYLIKKDGNQVAYIEWITQGKKPEVGADFSVRYDIAAHFDAGRIDVRNKRN